MPNFPELTILVNVWDQFSVPVPSLTAEDFRVLIAGNEVPVLSAENITENGTNLGGAGDRYR